jgi:CPA2 family monovalent cation:H+ antiporter-2
VIAAASSDAAVAFLELGAVALGLAALARLAQRMRMTAIPFYLVAGLLVGEGGVVHLDVSADFVRLAGEIGVLLLLLTLGLEYSGDELRVGLRAGIVPGVVDGVVNFLPAFVVGLALGWGGVAASLLGGVAWVSSSGVVAKLLTDFDRLGNRETPAVLNLLVVEDLAMAVYLPIVAALVARSSPGDTIVTVAVAVSAVIAILAFALRWGDRLSHLLHPASDEVLLLAVFGLTLLVGGLAERVHVSAAIGAFLVGLALSGPVQERAGALVRPLRDLFAAVFFLFFSYQIRPGALTGALAPAALLVVLGAAGKVATGWVASAPLGVGPTARWRAGITLIPRGEFSIVIASLGVSLAHGEDLGAVAATFVLLTTLVGSLASRSLAAPAAAR